MGKAVYTCRLKEKRKHITNIRVTQRRTFVSLNTTKPLAYMFSSTEYPTNIRIDALGPFSGAAAISPAACDAFFEVGLPTGKIVCAPSFKIFFSMQLGVKTCYAHHRQPQLGSYTLFIVSTKG